MSTVYLQGSEEVSRAAARMKEASSEMKSAADQIDDTLNRQRIWMDDWLRRLEDIRNEIRHTGQEPTD